MYGMELAVLVEAYCVDKRSRPDLRTQILESVVLVQPH